MKEGRVIRMFLRDKKILLFAYFRFEMCDVRPKFSRVSVNEIEILCEFDAVVCYSLFQTKANWIMKAFNTIASIEQKVGVGDSHFGHDNENEMKFVVHECWTFVGLYCVFVFFACWDKLAYFSWWRCQLIIVLSFTLRQVSEMCTQI